MAAGLALKTRNKLFPCSPALNDGAKLLEECFVTKDPFTPDKEKFLVLGSTCSLCSLCVCVGSDCSLFYTKRFCMKCVNKHLDQFPHQVQAELAKKKQSSRAAIS
ncbi:cysteine-rich DPF motif domain-containing protein 1 isoform X2 [Lates calcarifer]|uniref:Cysteine-rich DPF motif domain-containing protein 1 n=1 Tax=Lates calcarifer TaxID=8187 RepID=A0AAJ7VA32_LATCA|nr:cysteine-rich DPF motif domain-containing protein 1 isoform X2 [Lates calcarifer]